MRYAILAVLTLGLAAMPAMAVTDEVTDDDLQTFATIYMGMEQARTELSQEMAAAESTEAAEEIRGSANERMVAVIEEQGWTLERYNAVAAEVNEDPDKRSRVLDIIQGNS
jgi:hypothetical protein